MISPAAVKSASENPYVGPRPFQIEDRPKFFGRDREARDIVSLVIAHRALLLYAESGAGKSSLINAGVIPRLIEEIGCQVLPSVRVRGLIPEDIPYEGISNLYVFNTLLSWVEAEVDPRQLVQASLVDFLGKFERPTAEDEQPMPRVVIFDQFEELFISYPERWQDREDFFEQVRVATEEDPLLLVIFSMREDYIAQMDPYAPLLPENLRTRFRLERMGRGAALAAVNGPIRDTGIIYSEGVAEYLVEELLKVQAQVTPDETVEVVGQYVEPVQLQVVCESLWRELPAGVSIVHQSHVQTFGDVDRALSRFYENTILEVSEQSGVKEDDLREWFDQMLITSVGTRGTVFRGSEETGGIPNTVVDRLENLHLIRGEVRAGSRWYELTHDRLIEPIKGANGESNQLRERRARRQVRIRYGSIFSITVVLLAVFIGISVFALNARVEAKAAELEAQNQANAAKAAQERADALSAALVAADSGDERAQVLFAQLQATNLELERTKSLLNLLQSQSGMLSPTNTPRPTFTPQPSCDLAEQTSTHDAKLLRGCEQFRPFKFEGLPWMVEPSLDNCYAAVPCLVSPKTNPVTPATLVLEIETNWRRSGRTVSFYVKSSSVDCCGKLTMWIFPPEKEKTVIEFSRAQAWTRVEFELPPTLYQRVFWRYESPPFDYTRQIRLPEHRVWISDLTWDH